MRTNRFPPSVLAAILSASASESVILNSGRIEQRFGSYGIEVLASEAGLRRSSLVSFDGDVATCRTYAVVEFSERLDERYHETHSRVLAGGSIGATFREDGWDNRKHTIFIGTISMASKGTEVGKLMRLDGPADLALHVYQLVLVRQDMELEYATIMEAHHPEYLTEDGLREVFEYDQENTLSEADLSHLSELLFH